MYLNEKPVFAFGRGLSYTNFEYSNLKIASGHVGSDGTVNVNVDVKNTGDRAGDEVVQLYVHNNDKSATLPKEQLQGFERISLSPGESKTVAFALPIEQLSYWDTSKHAYVINPGTFDLMVGSASDDVRQKGSFEVTTAGVWPASTLTTKLADGDYSGMQK
jgi:beta-glucosidase